MTRVFDREIDGQDIKLIWAKGSWFAKDFVEVMLSDCTILRFKLDVLLSMVNEFNFYTKKARKHEYIISACPKE